MPADVTQPGHAAPVRHVLELRRPITAGQAAVARIVAFIVFAGLWEWGARAANSILIPTFLETVKSLFETMFVTGDVWPALWVSNIPMIVGYVISVVISVPLGLAMARWNVIDRMLSPITAVMLALPIAPLVPVVLVALGMGMTPKVVIIILFSWVFITTNVRAGTRQVDRHLVEMARSFGASEREVWFRILIPGGDSGGVRGPSHWPWSRIRGDGYCRADHAACRYRCAADGLPRRFPGRASLCNYNRRRDGGGSARPRDAGA